MLHFLGFIVKVIIDFALYGGWNSAVETGSQRLETLKQRKRNIESFLEAMERNCTPGELDWMRKNWLEPVEREIQEMIEARSGMPVFDSSPPIVNSSD